MPRLAVILALLVGGAFTGCLGGTEPNEPTVLVEPAAEASIAPRGPDDYWMVWVHGRETRPARPGHAEAMCSILFDHSLDEASDTLVFDPQAYSVEPDEVRHVIAFDVFAAWDSCPLRYELRFDEEVTRVDVGRYGLLRVETLDDGALLVGREETRVELGERMRISYDRIVDDAGWRHTVHGELTVVNLGAWPQARMST